MWDEMKYVRGLLAVSLDGAFHFPCYDHNGNIVAYVSESGDLAAQYVYDPYGGILAAHRGGGRVPLIKPNESVVYCLLGADG